MPQRSQLHAFLSVLALVTAPAGARSTTPGTAAEIVVSVCEHGSAKSLVAASLFARMAKEQGVAARAISRGTAPDPSVPEVVVQALRGDGAPPVSTNDVEARRDLVARIDRLLRELRTSAGARR